jgi:thiosulfate reductase cytochrome b subunit
MTKIKGPTIRERVHPVIIRITHWINALALLLMITSGIRIYNASPFLNDYKIPPLFQFGGLAGARQWHFFAMWVFFINGFVWFFYNLFTRHGRETTMFRARDIGGVSPMILYYLRIRKVHPPTKKYNSLQKLAYSSTPVLGFGALLTGISIYWPVQFSWVTAIFGGYDSARVFHFVFMSLFVFFILGHLLMVAIAGWNNFLSIFTGTIRVPAPEPEPTEQPAQL